MKINISRIINDIKNLNTFNETPNNGNTRYSFSKEDIAARNYLIAEMKKINLEVSTDNAGNLHGVYKCNFPEAKKLIIGSHIDTVPFGGSYDGVLGVVSALEVARVFYENKIQLKNDLEIIIFADEEGASFHSLIGSHGLMGHFNVEKIKTLKNKNGLSYYDALKNIEVNPDKISEAKLDFEKIIGMLELHIEQSIVLDSQNISIGLVKGIVAIRWFEIEIFGEVNHAGATPMNFRKDCMNELAHFITKLNPLLKSIDDDSLVITCGKIELTPNVPNIIPRSVKTIIDLRGINPENLEIIKNKLIELLEEIKAKGFSYSFKTLAESVSTVSNEYFLNTMKEILKSENQNFIEMYSGAGHDAGVLGEKIPIAMIFVPSVNGRSHCREEFTHEKDIEIGANLFLKTIHNILK